MTGAATGATRAGAAPGEAAARRPAPTRASTGWAPVPAYARTATSALPEAEAAGRALTGALGWLEAHLEWFAPTRWEEFLPRRPFRPGPLLELLGLVRLMARADVCDTACPLPSRALDLAERAVAEPDFEEGLYRADELFPYHLNLVALLGALGRPQPALRTACERLLAAGAGGHTRPYKPPLSRLELRYFLDRGGFRAHGRGHVPMPALGDLYRESIPAQRPDVLHLTGSETYALTHALFYATDFGAHRGLLGDREEQDRVRETVRVLLAVHLARGSLDLAAELLLCGATLGGVRDPGLTRRGWNTLAHAQRADGAVPSPVHCPDVLEGLTGDKAVAYVFGTCYHTTLAAALAATVRRETAPKTAPKTAPETAPRTPDTGPAPDLAPDLDPELPCADPAMILRWVEHLTETAQSEHRGAYETCSARLDPLLVLCVQARDLPTLAAVQRAARLLGRAEDPVPSAAAAYAAAAEGR
ncbi:hypothetical protein AB0C51_11170 [Streptomyces pathocidini]|uniref:DUF6895 family protein n=1 Tax=Streptomyces pathocidini TaxID=1650571 RepID=UPI0033E49890